jgi:hypothetical protein
LWELIVAKVLPSHKPIKQLQKDLENGQKCLVYLCIQHSINDEEATNWKAKDNEKLFNFIDHLITHHEKIS